MCATPPLPHGVLSACEVICKKLLYFCDDHWTSFRQDCKPGRNSIWLRQEIMKMQHWIDQYLTVRWHDYRILTNLRRFQRYKRSRALIVLMPGFTYYKYRYQNNELRWTLAMLNSPLIWALWVHATYLLTDNFIKSCDSPDWLSQTCYWSASSRLTKTFFFLPLVLAMWDMFQNMLKCRNTIIVSLVSSKYCNTNHCYCLATKGYLMSL